MRRYTFYISIALLAFGVGSFIVCSFVARKAVLSGDSVISLEEDAPQKVFANQNEKKSNKKKYLSDKEKALLLFQKTLSQWLSGQELESVVEPSAEAVKKINESNLDVVDQQILLQSAQKSYKTSFIEVNDDAKPELSILSNCSPPEFCELWIFEKTEKDFEVILSTYTEVENIKARKDKTKKYFDIETTHSYPKSDISLGMAIYKFDGKQYIKTECFDYIYLHKDNNGKIQELNKPKLISLHCC